jgi:hypothetical protein
VSIEPPAQVPEIPAARGTDVAEQAIGRLSQLKPKEPLTADQAEAVKQDLQQLIAEGDGAIPAIRQFLKQEQDFGFDSATSKLVGSPTLRTALIDTLRQVGSPEAMEVSHQVLGEAVDPLEVAQLARNLEEKAPGQFRQDELAAARNSLDLAADGKLKGRDVSPLFELFHAYGDESVAAQMKQIAERGKWLNYLPFVMAELPNGIGVSALTELADNPTVMARDQQSSIFKALAVAAANHREAATALAERARANQIPDAGWTQVALAISGNYSRPYTDTVFGGGTGQPVLSPEQVTQRLSLIDQLLAATTSPTARDALNQARTRLAAAPAGK